MKRIIYIILFVVFLVYSGWITLEVYSYRRILSNYKYLAAWNELGYAQDLSNPSVDRSQLATKAIGKLNIAVIDALEDRYHPSYGPLLIELRTYSKAGSWKLSNQIQQKFDDIDESQMVGKLMYE